MTRREARELAFTLLFEKTFTKDSMSDILQNAGEARDIQPDDFALNLVQGTEQHLAELDETISAFSHSWKKERISRVALSLMRLALYEMRYEDSIPVSVSINEAVELAKKYGGEEDAAFINGVLGAIARQEQPQQDGRSSS